MKDWIRRIRGKSLKDICLYVNDLIISHKRRYEYKKQINLDGTNICPSFYCLSYNEDYNICDSDIKIADSYLMHKFDVLGCGHKSLEYVNSYDIEQLQSHTCFNIKSIQELISSCCTEYKYIDWQKDLKNGYSFDVFTKSKDIKIPESKGIDIKIPWELARCQHLPFLARLYKATRNQKYKKEITCEIFDFIASNPVDYGVNWKCTMDVAIRVSNWIMALDLIGEKLDENIENIISKSIYQHCIFIRYHLEDQRDYRGNHYLSDIVGLLFSSTFFEPEGLIKKIQEFAIIKLISSIDEQFYEDGGNFESSLPYHRLSLELVLYGMWRVFRLSDHNPICRKYTDKICDNQNLKKKIARAFKMMLDAIKPDGNIYQLGDNDSGHLFRLFHYGEFLSPDEYWHRYHKKSGTSSQIWDENELCCLEILDVINAIVGIPIENGFINDLIGKVYQSAGLSIDLSSEFNQLNPIDKFPESIDIGMLPFKHEKRIRFRTEVDIEDIMSFFYSDFGLVGLRGKDFYLGVSITSVGQKGRGGHSHNDKLSYELYADGISYESDPGSYVYTESVEWRDKFRSVIAHNCPYFGEEQNLIGNNCFELRQRTICRLNLLTNDSIEVECCYGELHMVRRFELSKEELIISDYANKAFKVHPEFDYYSNGYGKILYKKGDFVK